METIIIESEDGSNTLYVPELKEYYHSIHGAISESRHVFIERGLQAHSGTDIHILEVGFGTGLNAILTFIEAEKKDITIRYTAIELYPLEEEVTSKLNYPKLIGEKYGKTSFSLHQAKWGEWEQISPFFNLKKINVNLVDFLPEDRYDVVYFDAFAPNIQPELWSENVLSKICDSINPKGILVTYSSKGQVRRTLKKFGLKVEKIPGPKGKREMIRAHKP